MPTTTDEKRAAFLRAVEAIRDDHPALSLREAYDLTRRHSTAFSTYASFAAYQRRDGRQAATDEATDDADHVRSEIESLFDELASHHDNPYTTGGYYRESARTLRESAEEAAKEMLEVEGYASPKHRRKRRNTPERTIPPTDPTT